MRNSATPRDGETRRPVAVLFVYSWDLLLAIIALFGALAPFAGGLGTGTGTAVIPVALQVVIAVASASYAATLIIVASLLTRRRVWVRRMQIVVMSTAIALGALSLAVGYFASTGIQLYGVLGTLLFLLFDALAVLIMTERRVTAWYNEPAPTPRYVLGTLVLWAVGSCTVVALSAVLR